MVRQAQSQDREAVFNLAKTFATSFVVEEGAFRLAFASILTDSSAYLAVSLDEIEGEIIGYVLAFSHQTFYTNGRVVWVEEITVAAHCRQQGIGKSLMHAVEGWAAQQDSPIVALATRRASDFYESIGYQASATYFRKNI